MIKYKLTNTFRMLKDNHVCKEGYRKLKKHLGSGSRLDAEINLLDVLNSNGVRDTLWMNSDERFGHMIRSAVGKRITYSELIA